MRNYFWLWFRRSSAYRFGRCRSGSNAVEFALVSPVLCLMVLGMAYIGLFVGTAHSVAQIAADVSRYAMVGHDGDERKALASRWMVLSASRYPLIDPKRLQLDLSEAEQMMVVKLNYDISYLPVPQLLAQSLNLQPGLVRTAAVLLP